MRKLFIMTVVLLLSSSSTSWSFDGARKGFVLGGGLGLASANLKVVSTGEEGSQGAGAGHLMIGYGWDDQNLLMLEGSAAVFDPDNSPFTVTQGWGGISWYHYFAPVDKSFYTVVGLGAMNFEVSTNVPGGVYSASSDPGFGLQVGAGYSFSRLFQAGLYIAGGKTSVEGPFPTEFRHLNVSILVSAVAF